MNTERIAPMNSDIHVHHKGPQPTISGQLLCTNKETKKNADYTLNFSHKITATTR